MDNVRLSAILEPALASPGLSNGRFSFSLLSEPGVAFQILAAPAADIPISNWTVVTNLTNFSGTLFYADPQTNLASRFYQARRLP